MSDDDRKVHDLSMRRRKQLQNDPVMKLADEVLKLVVGSMGEVDAAGQMVAVDLVATALVEAMKHSLGEVGLNAVVVEYEHRRRAYHLQWPEHDQTKTVYDKDEPDKPSADVVPLKKDDD